MNALSFIVVLCRVPRDHGLDASVESRLRLALLRTLNITSNHKIILDSKVGDFQFFVCYFNATSFQNFLLITMIPSLHYFRFDFLILFLSFHELINFWKLLVW